MMVRGRTIGAPEACRGAQRLVALGVQRDQLGRPADPGHDVVAGVDAQPAADALELQPVADVDAHRADRDALVAGDAVAAAGPVRVLLERRARLAAPLLVGDDVAVLVEQRRLEARPGAHVGADLLAREAGQQVGRGGEQAEEEVLRERGVAGQDRPGHGRRVVEVHDPGAAGGRGDQQPGGVLGAFLRDLLARRAAPCRGGCGRRGRPRSGARPT